MRLVRFSALAALSTFAAPLRAQTVPTVEPSLILDVAAAGFTDDANAQTGVNDPKEHGFSLQALELALASELGQAFRLDASASLRTDGFELDEAYGSTRALPFNLRARFGQFLTRVGRYNELHPHAWSFVDQPFALGRLFGSRGSRGVGAELSWRPRLPWDLDLAVSLTGAEGAENARSFYGNEDRRIRGPHQLVIVSSLEQKLALVDSWALEWGLNAIFGPNASAQDARTEIYATDLEVSSASVRDPRGIAWRMEAFYRRRDVPESLWDVNLLAELVGRFTRNLGAGARYEYGSPAHGDGPGITRDPLDPNWIDARHRLSANMTLWPTEHARFRLQTSRDAPDEGEPIWAFFFTAQLAGGPHASSAF